MSLNFSSPAPTKRKFPLFAANDNSERNATDPLSDDGESDDDQDRFYTPSEPLFSPFGSPPLLGQLNPYIESNLGGSDDGLMSDSASRKRQHPTNRKLPEPMEEEDATHYPLAKPGSHLRYQHFYVLPVLLLEFLAIALTRAVLPSILIEQYGSNVYVVLGVADCVRGVLAFFACPLFGKLSDVLGRKLCLFVTVMGSCAPVCSLAFFNWDDNGTTNLARSGWNSTTSITPEPSEAGLSTVLPPMAIPLFVVLLSLSGIFSSTFPLVFAYISDSIQERNERVTAYGLALATFGLSFTIGPMAGGYLASSKTDYVFRCSLALALLDILYIYTILPESISPKIPVFPRSKYHTLAERSASSISARTMLLQVADAISWNPWDSIVLVLHDPFLRKVGQVAFFYYTGLWAVLSTLSLYAVQHFKMTPQILGELMSALGLSTMVAEAVLVRFLVPLLGEKRAVRIGLVSFGIQCFVLGMANQPWQLFFCVALSLLGNLVYPSLSSLVSGIVEPETVGEALGAINGIKALTEGIGPLIFGTLMTFSEHTRFPGSPYWLAGVLVFVAHYLSNKLPANSDFPSPSCDPISRTPLSPESDYVHELEFKRRYRQHSFPHKAGGDVEDDCLATMFPKHVRDDDDEEYQGLLSEVDEDSDEWEEIHPLSSSTKRGTDNLSSRTKRDCGLKRTPILR